MRRCSRMVTSIVSAAVSDEPGRHPRRIAPTIRAFAAATADRLPARAQPARRPAPARPRPARGRHRQQDLLDAADHIFRVALVASGRAHRHLHHDRRSGTPLVDDVRRHAATHDNAFEQRVRGQPVRAVQAGGGHFARSPEPGNVVRPARRSRPHPCSSARPAKREPVAPGSIPASATVAEDGRKVLRERLARPLGRRGRPVPGRQVGGRWPGPPRRGRKLAVGRDRSAAHVVDQDRAFSPQSLGQQWHWSVGGSPGDGRSPPPAPSGGTGRTRDRPAQPGAGRQGNPVTHGLGWRRRHRPQMRIPTGGHHHRGRNPSHQLTWSPRTRVNTATRDADAQQIDRQMPVAKMRTPGTVGGDLATHGPAPRRWRHLSVNDALAPWAASRPSATSRRRQSERAPMPGSASLTRRGRRRNDTGHSLIDQAGARGHRVGGVVGRAIMEADCGGHPTLRPRDWSRPPRAGDPSTTSPRPGRRHAQLPTRARGATLGELQRGRQPGHPGADDHGPVRAEVDEMVRRHLGQRAPRALVGHGHQRFPDLGTAAADREHPVDRAAGPFGTPGSTTTSVVMVSSEWRIFARVIRFMCGHRLQGRTNSVPVVTRGRRCPPSSIR